MPEVQEGVISNATVSNAVKSIKIKHGSVENGPYCRSAYGDVTAAEKEQDAKIKSTNPSKGFPSGSNAQLGLPIELKLDNKAVRDLRRGMTGKQTPILFGPELEPPQGYQALQLLEVVTSPRNVILKLGPNLWLQAQLFTATAVNVYTQDAFHHGLMKMGRSIRKFSITLALDFEEFVVAFVSSDGITQFHWASTLDALPANHFDPLRDYRHYLTEIVTWLSTRRPSATKPAQEVIRTNGQHFPGVGMYTVNELFARAGLPIDIPDKDLWRCACCAARLVEALWTVHTVASERVRTLLPPMLNGGLTIGVTQQQRLEYAQSLLVYGKQEMKTTFRMRSQCIEYNASIDASQPPTYHAFEPSLIAKALGKPSGVNLSHLVFKTDELVPPVTPDPLTTYYDSQGLLHTSGAHVHPSCYEPRFIDLTSYKQSKAVTFLIKIKNKHVWSLMKPNPTWGIGVLGTLEAKNGMLFANRVSNSLKEVVGPRDYVGMPRRITLGKVTELMVCNFDPRLPPQFMKHVLTQARNVSEDTARRWETEYKAWMKLVKTDRPNFGDGNQRKRKSSEDQENVETYLAKKKRLSADKRLALTYVAQ